MVANCTATVILVVPPFCGIESPSLGVSALVAQCQAEGVTACAHYENLRFAAEVSPDVYDVFALSPATSMMGEGVFALEAFPAKLGHDDPAQLMQMIGRGFTIPGVDQPTSESSLWKTIRPEHIEDALGFVDKFLDDAVERILRKCPKIVGFSSTFQQTMASIAIARRLKQHDKGIITVLGGANAVSPMGEEIQRVAQVFDYVFSGEADFAFPRFVADIVENNERERVIECDPIESMDSLATPDYSDYFSELQEVDNPLLSVEKFPKWLYFESSRGCWWGQKNHCTFCGLNANGMNHREKSADRVLSEIGKIVCQYGVSRIHATDNILPVRYTKTLLPRLSEEFGDEISFFYEVKSNLKEADLDQFKSAGISMIQPGIESLSSNVLKVMRKGVSSTQNIALLRNSLERSIYVSWNVLMGFPGETVDDYQAMLEAIPFLEHLQPPEAWGLVRFDRFSPYHSNPEAFGISNLQPFPGYQYVFPKGTNLSDVAYYFVGEYDAPTVRDGEIRKGVEELLTQWKAAWSGNDIPKLQKLNIPQAGTLIFDTRKISARRYSEVSREMLTLLDDLRSPKKGEAVKEIYGRDLDFAIRNGWVLEHDEHLVALV